MYLIDRFAGAFRHNAQKIWSALLCRPLRRVTNMCSSNLSVNCEYFTKFTLWYPDCRSPYFEAVTCRQSAPDYPRERGDSQEGGNRRCLPSCAPARRQRTFPRSAERNSPLNLSEKDCRPSGANTLAQFVYPAQPVLKKAASRIGRSAMRLVYPGKPMQGNWLTSLA